MRALAAVSAEILGGHAREEGCFRSRQDTELYCCRPEMRCARIVNSTLLHPPELVDKQSGNLSSCWLSPCSAGLVHMCRQCMRLPSPTLLLDACRCRPGTKQEPSLHHPLELPPGLPDEGLEAVGLVEVCQHGVQALHCWLAARGCMANILSACRGVVCRKSAAPEMHQAAACGGVRTHVGVVLLHVHADVALAQVVAGVQVREDKEQLVRSVCACTCQSLSRSMSCNEEIAAQGGEVTLAEVQAQARPVHVQGLPQGVQLALPQSLIVGQSCTRTCCVSEVTMSGAVILYTVIFIGAALSSLNTTHTCLLALQLLRLLVQRLL